MSQINFDRDTFKVLNPVPSGILEAENTDKAALISLFTTSPFLHDFGHLVPDDARFERWDEAWTKSIPAQAHIVIRKDFIEDVKRNLIDANWVESED